MRKWKKKKKTNETTSSQSKYMNANGSTSSVICEWSLEYEWSMWYGNEKMECMLSIRKYITVLILCVQINLHNFQYGVCKFEHSYMCDVIQCHGMAWMGYHDKMNIKMYQSYGSELIHEPWTCMYLLKGLKFD